MNTDQKMVICVLGAVGSGAATVNLSMPSWAAGLLLLLTGWLFTAGAWFKVKSLSDEHDLPYYAMIAFAIIFSLVMIFLTGLTLYAVLFG